MGKHAAATDATPEELVRAMARQGLLEGLTGWHRHRKLIHGGVHQEIPDLLILHGKMIRHPVFLQLESTKNLGVNVRSGEGSLVIHQLNQWCSDVT